MKTHSFLSFGLLLGGFLATSAYAEEVDIGKRIPSDTEIIKALSPENPDDKAQETNDTEGENTTESEGKSRSIPSLKPVITQPTKKPTYAAPPKRDSKSKVAHKSDDKKTERKVALSIQIVFDYNSPELTEFAKEQLKPIGKAMNSDQLKNLKFIVEGHTDAVGSDTYNYVLSKERANSVRNFLISNFSIQDTRIESLGKGKRELLDRDHPDSEVNRRVRILVRQ